MFKIALLYSGQPRHLKEAFPNHHDTFWKPNNSYQIDVFAHMWYDEKWIGNYFWDQYKDRGRWEADLKEFMQDNWNPKAITFEEPKEFEPEDIVPDPRFPHPVNNIISQFYSISQANDLKKKYEDENNFKYDVVVRLRTDEYFQRPLGPINEYNLDSINVLKEWAHVEHGINDHFAFGSSELMDKYLDVYENFVEIAEMGAEINPECIIGFNAQIRHKLPITKNDWKYVLWRDKK